MTEGNNTIALRRRSFLGRPARVGRASRRFTRGLVLGAPMLCAVILLGSGCETGDSAGTSGQPAASTGVATPGASDAATPAAGGAGGGAGSTPSAAAAAAQNLPVDDTVREQLVVAWINGNHGSDAPKLTRADVVSTTP